MDVKDNRYVELLERARHDWMPLEARWNWHKFVEDRPNDPPRRPANENEAANSKAIAIDCWKYRSGGGVSDSSNVRYLHNKEIEAWLKEPPPTVDGQLPLATLKLIQKCMHNTNDAPFESSTFAMINEVFDLPRVDLSYAARKSGACGTLFTKNLNPGIEMAILVHSNAKYRQFLYVKGQTTILLLQLLLGMTRKRTPRWVLFSLAHSRGSTGPYWTYLTNLQNMIIRS